MNLFIFPNLKQYYLVVYYLNILMCRKSTSNIIALFKYILHTLIYYINRDANPPDFCIPMFVKIFAFFKAGIMRLNNTRIFIVRYLFQISGVLAALHDYKKKKL